MTHCRSANVESRSCWMLGSATFTIVMSSSSMNVPRQTAPSVHHFGSGFARLFATKGSWHASVVTNATGMNAEAQHLRNLALLRRVRDRIHRDYAQPLDVEALARGGHMSAGHLSREFRAAYGESPYSYLMTRRIERAMALLRRGDLSVTDVCFTVGCSSLGTSSTRFTELVGMPPSVYRREATDATAGIPPCVAKQVTRPVRNREAPAAAKPLA